MLQSFGLPHLHLRRPLNVALVLAAFLYSLPSGALPPHIPFFTVSNAANYGNLAPGSLANINVVGLSVLNLTLTGLDQVPVTFTTSDGQEYQVMAIPKDDKNLTVVVPPAAPVGQLGIRIDVSGTPLMGSIYLVDYAPAIFSLSGAAYGVVKAALTTDEGYLLSGMTRPAVAGEYVSIWTTGLHGAGPDNTKVWVADTSIAPDYVGASGYGGIEQINFSLPPHTKMGCYVPLAVEVHGVRSRYLALPIYDKPEPCVHPLGLSDAELATLDADALTDKAEVDLGVLKMTRNYDPGEGFDYNIDIGFGPIQPSRLFEFTGLQLTPPMSYSCRPLRDSDKMLLDPSYAPRGLLTGGSLVLLGPGGKQIQLKADQPTNAPGYGMDLVTDDPNYFPGGDWMMQISAGTDVPALQQPFHLPPVPSWETPLDETIHLYRNQYNEVRWDPTGYAQGEWMLVSANSLGCFVPANWGWTLIPGQMLDPNPTQQMSLTVFPEAGAPKTFPVELTDGSKIRAVVSYVVAGMAREATAE